MTTTQVQYWNYRESVRHNLATERLGTDTLAETHRHNVETERLGTETLAETIRHNLSTEDISMQNLEETVRHNKKTEKETKRHNKASESIDRKSNKIKEKANKIEEDKNRIRREELEEQKRRDDIYAQQVSAEVQLKKILGDKYNAEILNIAKETENMNLYKIITSKGSPEVAKKIAAGILLADTVADPNQSKTIKSQAYKQLLNLMASDDAFEESLKDPEHFSKVTKNGKTYYISKQADSHGTHLVYYNKIPGFLNKKGEWRRLVP